MKSEGATDFDCRITLLRYCAAEIGKLEMESAGTSHFDARFWEDMDGVEAAARARDDHSAEWLVGLTQLDDIADPALWHLAQAALAALALMPRVALAAARRVESTLGDDASKYRKVGLCLVFESTGLAECEPSIERFVNDLDCYVRSEAVWALKRLRLAARGCDEVL